MEIVSEKTMWLKTRCELGFNIVDPTPFVFMLRPRSAASQWVMQEMYDVQPRIQVTEAMDPFGNLCQRLIAPKGDFRIQTSSLVMTADHSDVDHTAEFTPVPELPDEILTFLLPSRYCEADRHNALALEIVNTSAPGYPQVESIVEWIRHYVEYVPGSSGYPVSAVEVVERRYGVCRDLAHVGISLCRSLCIPARLVVGYLHGLEPMDIHAWFEAYVGERWFTFDATQRNLEGARIAIAYGRDAADVAICNQYGPAVDPSRMFVDVTEEKSESLPGMD
jgi:transglutaminase-like putative cysteine protease